jgi:hypothetical protein
MSGKSKLSWYTHRLKAMGVGELVQRVSDKVKHQSDAKFSKRIEAVQLGDTIADFPTLPRKQDCPARLRAKLADDVTMLLAGEWRLFGWRDVSTGAPPCWHRDASCGVIIEPDGLSYKLDHRALPDGADPRAIWEINRWSEMTRVAMHAWINHDTDSARTAQIWLEDWCDRNAPGYGVNWTSPLEVGLRLINFCWFDALIHGLENESLSTRQRLLADRVVPAHAFWVHRYRSYGSSANNHLLGELVGLLHAVKRWPSLEQQVCSATELWEEIAEVVVDQFAEDGGNKEQALHYHLFGWEMAWHAARLMNLQSSPVLDRLRRAAEFFVRMVHPLESWDYGDSDDAQVLPIVLNRGDALSEWQSWLADHSHGDAIGFWIGLSPARNHITGALDQPGWWLAEHSGMAVCELDHWMLRLDASPLGYGSLAAHGHCDALHLSIWDGPVALVIDPGTGGYYGMTERRTELASWEVHNGPRAAEAYQTPKHAGTFLWTDHHQRPTAEWLSSRKMRAGLQHEGRSFHRTVEVGLDGFIRVEDSCEADHELVVQWTFSPECTLDESAAPLIVVKRGDLRWKLELDTHTIVSAHVGELMVSRHYGKLEPATTLQIKARKRLRCTWSRM